ncbi:gag-pol polyprotein [Tanacetum coccineum]
MFRGRLYLITGVRRNRCSTIRHGTPAKNIPFGQTKCPQEEALNTRGTPVVEGKSVSLVKRGDNQRGKSEQSLIREVEETLRKLKRVNIKVDPKASTFGVDEGNFFGHVVTKNEVHSKTEELKGPIREVRMKVDAMAGSGWTNTAEEAFQRIKRKMNKLQELSIPRDREILMLCLLPKEDTISYMLFVQREGVHTPVSYEGGRRIVGTKVFETWEAGPGSYTWGKETINEGTGVGMVLVNPDKTTYSYAIRLNFIASRNIMDSEALLAELGASARQGMKNLHVFIDSPILVAQVEGNYAPAIQQERKYKAEIIEATNPFYRFRITHLPKILNSKVEVISGLETIKLEFLNQEVSVGIKTRPSVEGAGISKGGKRQARLQEKNQGTMRKLAEAME